MTLTRLVPVGFILLCTGLTGCERQVSFADDIEPLIVGSCLTCHDQNSEGYLNSGFSLETYDSLMKGTKFGPVVVAGSPESSSLYLVVAHKTAPEIHMPPHTDDALAEGRGVSLTEEQIETVRLWIAQGAKNN
ncbi:MAG: hypothetical protein P8X81_10205 [Woeseiaceae bacterium]|jgi:hypothetical protein